MRQFTILKKDILRGKKQFSDLFNNGVFLRGTLINIIYQRSNSFRIAFTVSKKLKINAKRNKLKRHLREIYRTNKDEFPDNQHIVIITKKDKYNFHELKTEIITKVRKIN